MQNLFASKVCYIARRVPCRCCHVHGVHCDCYRHRVVALHIASTAPLRGGDSNHNKHCAYGGSDVVLASLYIACLQSKQVRPAHVSTYTTTFHVMLSACLADIDMLSMYVGN